MKSIALFGIFSLPYVFWLSAQVVSTTPPVVQHAPRIVQIDSYQIVFTQVDRSMASPLLAFSDPHELYPWHEFRSADGLQRIRVMDLSSALPDAGDSLRIIYMGCTKDQAVHIIRIALSQCHKT